MAVTKIKNYSETKKIYIKDNYIIITKTYVSLKQI